MHDMSPFTKTKWLMVLGEMSLFTLRIIQSLQIHPVIKVQLLNVKAVVSITLKG